MLKTIPIVALMITACALADEPAPTTSVDPSDGWLAVKWDSGIRLESAKANSWLKFGGRVEGDVGWINGNALEEELNETFRDRGIWRRLRPAMTGEIDDFLALGFYIDFAGPGTTLFDAYLSFINLPGVGSVTIGHVDHPFGLEQLASTKDITFMERGLGDALIPGRAWSVKIGGPILDKRAQWAMAISRNTDDQFSGDEDEGRACNVGGRFTGLLRNEDAGADLIHLGASYRLGRPERPISYSTKPEAAFAPTFVDTGPIDADWVNLFGTEATWVYGPLSLQGEFVSSVVDTADIGTLCFNSWYVQASYFLTGEHRVYDADEGFFTRPEPFRPFPCDGWGAWQIAARLSWLDLGKAHLPPSARALTNGTVGVSWYPNTNVRIHWNYVRSCVENTDAADIFQMRLALMF